MENLEAKADASLGVDAALKRFLEAAGALESGLQALSLPLSDSSEIAAPDYQRLRAILSTCMPAFYTAYDGFVHAALEQDARPVTCSSGC